MSGSPDECTEVSPECPVEDTIYGYAPNLGGNGFYAVIFAVCALAQCYFICRYWRLWKGYSILVFVGCVGECCGYVGRILLHNNPWDGASMTIQLLLLMISPSFLAAALYMTLRTLVHYVGQEHTRLPARFWTWPFVTADLIGFVSQCGGGIISAMGGDGTNPNLATLGNTIMIVGVAFQAVVMVIAGALATDFALRIRRRQGSYVFQGMPRDLKVFLLSMTAAFLLILTRCIYRIPEMAGGVGGHLMRQEAEFMIFDGLMIVVSVILLTVVHPGVFASATHELKMHAYQPKAQSNDVESAHEMYSGVEPSHGQQRDHDGYHSC